jgi:hypothetical protein
LCDAGAVIADLDDVQKFDAEDAKFLGEKRGVGVGDVAEDQLATYREDIGTHAAVSVLSEVLAGKRNWIY